MADAASKYWRLADLDALKAAVLEAKNAPAGGPAEGVVFQPEGQELDGPLRRAIINALPEATTFGFNSDTGERTWMHIIGPGDSSNPVLTREVPNTAHCPRLNSQRVREFGPAGLAS